MTNIEKAKAHFNYGINCDIFSEPVRSYAKMAVIALEKQIPKKVEEYLTSSFCCPACTSVLSRYSQYCSNCGQALDWSDSE